MCDFVAASKTEIRVTENRAGLVLLATKVNKRPTAGLVCWRTGHGLTRHC